MTRMPVPRAAAGALLLALGLTPSAARAQAGAAVAVGAGINVYRPASPQADDFVAFGLVYRLVPQRSGWRPAVGFNWYSVDMWTEAAGVRHPLGSLRLRPIMAGYGYTHRMGAFALSATALAGYSFNTFEVHERARRAYRDELGLLLLEAGASNRPVIKSELALWYDLDDRVGLIVSLAGIAARSNLAVLTDGDRRRIALRADTVKVLVGAAYGLF
ncbi:MAG TPA: hypothetical protein VNI78_05445 [Vicinamibacterales bacterium]|nr:hypothetical protein [Vicinamibacterales bacterium]